MSDSEPGSEIEDFDSASFPSDIDDTELDDYEPEDDTVGAGRKESNFTVLTINEIMDEQMSQISRVAELFEVPPATARQLLTHMKWNVDRLIECYYGGEADELFTKGGIADPRNANSAMKMRKINKDGTEECTICLTDFKPEEMSCLPCGHNFCVGCWQDYLHVKIMSDGKAKSITCPAKDCIMLVDEVTITNLLKDETILSRYQTLVADAYVADNMNVRWCPGKNCDRAIRVRLLRDKEIRCSHCSTKFCFGCGDEPHAPADCKMVRDWRTKTAAEGENAEWMAKFTKDCPKCGYLIHKEGGCQYMSCSNCSHKFCWVCLGNFDHKSHNCGAYKEEAGADKNSKRAILHKYMHFYTRYQVHAQSSQLEDRLMAAAERYMEQEVEKGIAWIDLQHIKEATLQLTEARNMLKWTYVYGYFLPPTVNREIFEYLQSDLESQTERLSGILEAKGDKEKSKIISSAQQVKLRVKNLLEGLAEGDITGGDKSERTYDGSKFETYEGWIYKA
jgi:ariadne-1